MSTSADQQARTSDIVPNLHDATLNTVNFDWSRGLVYLTLKIDVTVLGSIEAKGVTALKCSRLLPWGPSSSINSGTVETLAGGQRLTIEMQSGDVIEICCREFAYKPAL